MEKLIRVILIGVMSVFSCASILSAADITYTYDSLGRLVGADYGPGGQLTYSYDAAGNRITADSVAADNEAPVAVDDVLSVGQDEVGSLDPLANDTDAEADVLSITSATDGSNGTVMVIDGLTLSYTPTAGFSGNDSFSYTIADVYNNSATANVAVTVTANIAPVAVDDILTAGQDDVTPLDPIANDTDAEDDTLSIISATNGSNSTVTVIDGLTLSYTPAAGFNGSDSFSYTISDGHSNTATANITVTVTENVAPVAIDDAFSVSQDDVGSFNPLSNDTDAENDTLTITTATDGSNGTVIVIDGLTLSYTPAAGFNGSDSFSYTISDGHSNTATANITVTVTENVAPVAVDDVLSVDQDEAGSLDPLANDTDAEGDTLSITLATDGSNGIVTVVSGLTLNYTPAVGFYGSDSFSYTISDAHSNSATANVTVTIVENVAPVAVDDVLSIEHNTPGSFNPLSNDSDAENDTLTITSVTNGSNGTVAINGLTLTYTPTGGFSGADSFTYTISDGHSNSATAAVVVTVSANAAPVAIDDVLFVDHDTTGSLDPLANDTDLESDTLTVTSATDGGNGVVTVVGGLTLTYTPSSGFSGADSFTYTISDGHSNSATAAVVVTVSANAAPVAVDDVLFVDHNTTGSLDPLANDTDLESDTLTITSATDGGNGVVTVVGGLTLTYTPSSGFSGADSFTYTISDGHGNSATAIVTVTVGVNAAPIAVDDIISVGQDEVGSVDPLANDSDAEGDVLTITSATNGANGVVTVVDGLMLSYVPVNGFNGTDSFSYTISDGHGNNAAANVVVTVTENVAPVAVGDALTVAQDEAASIDPLVNDTDAEGDTLTVIAATNGGNGTVSIVDGLILTYTPTVGFSGSDSFTYTISDGHNNIVTATVVVTVTANAPPVAEDDALTVTEDASGTLDPIANDSDAEGDTLSITSATDGGNGAVTIVGGLTLTYTAANGFLGMDSFSYTISDGHSNTDTATVFVTVNPAPNLAPIAVDDFSATKLGSTTKVKIYSTVNDHDPDGDPLTVTSYSNPLHGSVAWSSSNSSFSYNPTGVPLGEDSFTYTISDGQGNSSTATVRIIVSLAGSSPPVAVDDTFIAVQGHTTRFNPRANDTDPDNENLKIVKVNTSGAQGTITRIDYLYIDYTPDPGFLGADTFTYKIRDGANNTSWGQVTVTVVP